MKTPLSPSQSNWSLVFSKMNAVLTTTIVIALLATCTASAAQDQVQINYPSRSATVDVQVTINSSKVLHMTNEKFVSVAFTAGDLRSHWQLYNLRSVRLHTLAKGLYPSYLRLGGTTANFATFKENTLASKKHHFTNFTYTGKDWDEINNFSQAVGWDFIFDVNEFLRINDKWDPTNFETLLDYNTIRNYTVTAWQLGNEPNAYPHGQGVTIKARQVAEDYIKLRAILNSKSEYANALIIGPDTTEPRLTLETSAVKFLQRFLSKCGECTNVTTFHSYYLSLPSAKLDDFINPSTLDNLMYEISDIRDIVTKYRRQVPPRIWLTETGDAVPGGMSGISDRYVGGFPYLDKLGMGAKQGLEVIMKQQFIGRFCGLVNESNYNPRPVYWVAYIHKQLVGQRVLNVTTNQQGINTLRVYAHCTRTKNPKYDPGDVTMIVLNLDKAKSVQLKLQGVLANKNIDEYLLTPNGDEGLQARYVNLNDVQLQMFSDTRLPELNQRPLIPPQTITLPPLTYGFYIITKANLRVCI